MARPVSATVPDSRELTAKDTELVPGFLTTIGVVLVSGLASWLGIMVPAVAATLILGDMEGLPRGAAKLVLIPLWSAFGFIPIFIYGAWIGMQVRG